LIGTSNPSKLSVAAACILAYAAFSREKSMAGILASLACFI